MKRILLAFLLFSTGTYAQDSAIARSKFQQFSSPTGHMYKHETIPLGSIRDIKISISKTTDLQDGSSTKAILLTQKPVLGPVEAYSSLFIDMEEAEGVYKALHYYLEVIKEKAKNLPVYTYSTSNDIVLSCRMVEGAYGFGWHVQIDQRYHYSRNIVPGSSISLKNKDIDDLAALTKKAMESAL